MIKRNLTNLLTIFVAFALFSSSKCKPDHEPEEESTSFLVSTLKAHKWVTFDSSYGEGSNDHAWVDMETVTLYFTSDSEGIEYWVIKDYDTNLGNSARTEYNMFSYTVFGSVVTIIDESHNVSRFQYLNDILVSESGTAYFQAASLTSQDYSIINKIGPKGGSCGDNLNFSYDDRTCELKISGTGRMNDYSKANQPWHDYYITKVTINDGCTYIGAHAFNNLQLITEVCLPSSIREIGEYAFCNVLISKLTVPSKIEKIGAYAFSECKNLKNANFSGCDALEYIGDFVFGSCPLNMGNFTMPKNVKTIGTFAFGSSTFSDLTLNDKLETVGQGAMGKINANKLVIPNSVKQIASVAFNGNFNEIRIGTGLTSIDGAPFVSSKSGSIYVNSGKPAMFTSTIDPYIIINKSGNDASSSWTLYVPKGCKSAYQSATGWRSFRSIIEDSSLEGSNSSSENEDNGGKNQEDDKPANRGEVATSFRGSGSQSNPYIISTAAELRKLSDDCANGENYKDKYFKMTADITINRNVLRYDGELNSDNIDKFELWIPIGYFAGNFDGCGHTISGIYYNNEEKSQIGLFGIASHGCIKNLTLNESYISGLSKIGGIVGDGNSQLISCKVTNSTIIGAFQNIGGIVGSHSGTNIINCVNYGRVSGTTGVGGIVGYARGDIARFNIVNCLNKGEVKGFKKISGIAGLDYKCDIEYCVNIGTVMDGKGGAMAGELHMSSLKNNYYLKTSCKDLYLTYKSLSGSTRKPNTAMTSDEMKQQSFLIELNNNVKSLGSDYVGWKFDNDGYPTLDIGN